MISAGHFFLTTLPQLGELGSAPPFGLADLLEHVEENRKWRELLEALLIADDILQRESLLAGETDEVKPAVFSIPQARAEAPLPEVLAAAESTSFDASSSPLQVDTLWERYFRFAYQVAQSHGSTFLAQWVKFEVGLRNALAAERARRLLLDETDYRVAVDLEDSHYDFAPLLSEWEAASTPLEGFHVILRARWSWLEDHDAWYSFSVDEMLAYAARLMLLEQWARIQPGVRP